MQGQSLFCSFLLPSRSVANLEFRHYVAFIRKSLPGDDGLSWVMFNDEKVVKSEDIERMKSTAYMYFFSRI